MKLLLAVVLLAALAGCSGSDGAATPTSPTSGESGPAIVTAVTLRGNAILTAIGETTAADGDRLPVGWHQPERHHRGAVGLERHLEHRRLPGGMVTVIRFGQSHVSATYEGESATLNVQATPPGTFVVWGRAWEPGNGGLAGVTVREESSGISALSNMDGEFSFGGLTASG